MNILIYFILLPLLSPIQIEADTLVVSLPDTFAYSNEIISLPLYLNSISEAEIVSYQFNVQYDRTALEVLGVTTSLSISAHWGEAVANTNTKGIIRIAHAGAFSLMTKGILLYLNFTVKTSASSESKIILSEFMFNEGNPACKVKNGTIEIKH